MENARVGVPKGSPAKDQQAAGVGILLQIMMLVLSFVLGHVLRRHRFYYLPEASASLLIGNSDALWFLFIVVCNYFVLHFTWCILVIYLALMKWMWDTGLIVGALANISNTQTSIRFSLCTHCLVVVLSNQTYVGILNLYLHLLICIGFAGHGSTFTRSSSSYFCCPPLSYILSLWTLPRLNQCYFILFFSSSYFDFKMMYFFNLVFVFTQSGFSLQPVSILLLVHIALSLSLWAVVQSPCNLIILRREVLCGSLIHQTNLIVP